MPRRGEQHHNATLSDVQVVHMRERRQKNGWTYSRIATEVGCSLWTARDICDYRTRITPISLNPLSRSSA